MSEHDLFDSRRVIYTQTITYEVITTSNLFHPSNPALLAAGHRINARRFVVVDAAIEAHYGEAMRAYFDHHRIQARIVSFPGGEENKTLEHYLRILRELEAFPIYRRDEPILAIGGGVLTDLVGFVAASYRRGVPYIKVPTTLMGYVDASIGIKTGINFNGSNNRLGAFHPPRLVLLDKAFLRTLPRRHLLNGVCEIIKLAVIRDAELFDWLEWYGPESVEACFQNQQGEAILHRAIQGMLEELEPNLFEDDLERKVDFGHTFSYGLEARYPDHLLHGEAVLLDILLSSLIAQARRLLSGWEVERLFRLVHSLGFELDYNLLDPSLLWESLVERTYHRNGLQRVPLPKEIGQCVFVNDIDRQEIERAVHALKEWIGVKV